MPRHGGPVLNWDQITGFFAGLCPDIFHDGHGDLTCKDRMLVPLEFVDWAEHISWAGDGRVMGHPWLVLYLRSVICQIQVRRQQQVIE